MRGTVLMAALAAFLLLPLAFSPPAWSATDPKEYVGSETCAQCHMEKYNDWKVSGHPYKLRPASVAKYAPLPLPEGYTWDDISYVIGGASLKARKIKKKGYIITKTGPNKDQPGKNQYNMRTGTWANYHPGEKKGYTCGQCHTTGYSPEGHQDGLEGIKGTWVAPGIQCERCHGPGKAHVEAGGDKTKIDIDKKASLCGECHIRGKVGEVPASKGFIKHHEQYNELMVSAKSKFKCVTCHDPHKTAKFSIRKECSKCHAKQAKAYKVTTMAKVGVDCKDCHMARASKSAVAMSRNEGDVRTHLFKINLDPAAKQFTEDGKSSNPYIISQYACLNCHKDKDAAWAQANGKVH